MESSSSSCLHSAISSESSLDLAGSTVRKRQRAFSSSRSEFELLPGFETDAKRSKLTEKCTSNSAMDTSISEESEIIGGFPSRNLSNEVETSLRDSEISESSCLESISYAKFPKNEGVRSLISHHSVDLESDLVCSEKFSAADDGVSSDQSASNELTLSQFEEELFRWCSEEADCSSSSSSSEYSLSDLVSSGDDFSDGSRDGSAPSASFSLFLQLRDQFSRSNSCTRVRASSGSEEDWSPEFTVMTFEEDEDEESYVRFRSRERKETMVHDYGEEYSFSTEHGRLILEQRLLMVSWIVEHSNAMELQLETLFLGVDLMDRSLSRGYFNSVQNLQLLGISCITLATRIEENQPYNNIRQRSFRVGDNVYSRSEVVAMEWMVQEVLNFQLFHPTIHHFLWFYLKTVRADAKVEHMARCLAVLTLLDHERLSFWPSTVAAGLVILACLATDQDSSCHTVMETHVRTKNDDLPECIKSLDWLVKYAA
ncbi:cyclin-SDS-like [Typha latifolia]|uniref:cyclin-SDS-like n=1 Tax=Typha latifolia TaxID=4733 RepID=UPI003C2E8469